MTPGCGRTSRRWRRRRSTGGRGWRRLQAIHNARLATQRSHWVALHGDGSGGRSIKFWQTEAAGVPVKCITVDLNDDNVKVSAVMARKGTGTSEPFRQMILRAQPNVAVTGTFFSLDNLRPVGDIVIDGSLIHFGGMGTALCITPGQPRPDGDVRVGPAPRLESLRLRGRLRPAPARAGAASCWTRAPSGSATSTCSPPTPASPSASRAATRSSS